ncbi:MAG: recombinase family protein, partial [Actinomycetota bacterium]|nr:recombinase family protein [Actinomycetota bacterium]
VFACLPIRRQKCSPMTNNSELSLSDVAEVLRRPGLQRALGACASGEVGGIVVAKLDRLSRSLIDFAGLLTRAQAEGWNVVALDLGVDLSTPSGEFLANVMSSAAQWERRIIGQRTKDALAVKRAQGVRLGRPTSTPDDVAKRIRKMRRDGLTLQAICDKLNSESVQTPRHGLVWRPSSLRAILALKSARRSRVVRDLDRWGPPPDWADRA